MSEPTYGSGPSYEGGGQGYGGQQPQYGGQPPGYGGQQYGGGGGQYPPQPGPPTGPPSGGFPAAGGGYPGTPLPTPSAPRTPTDRLALVATVITIVGYVCAGGGVLNFILDLTIDFGDGTAKFSAALGDLIIGLGLGGLNFAVGTWLGTRTTGSR
jgi:hypothetical protein